MYVYFKRIRLFASLIVFYMYYYTYNAWKNIYTEKKEVFFRDFSINIPINLFCEIFSHLINALQFLKISQCRSSIYLIWELILNINVYQQCPITLEYQEYLFHLKTIYCNPYSSKLTKLNLCDSVNRCRRFDYHNVHYLHL